jgi:hypothetical protein
MSDLPSVDAGREQGKLRLRTSKSFKRRQRKKLQLGKGGQCVPEVSEKKTGNVQPAKTGKSSVGELRDDSASVKEAVHHAMKNMYFRRYGSSVSVGKFKGYGMFKDDEVCDEDDHESAAKVDDEDEASEHEFCYTCRFATSDNRIGPYSCGFFMCEMYKLCSLED